VRCFGLCVAIFGLVCRLALLVVVLVHGGEEFVFVDGVGV
jgi:hypothetical protein